jgi:hypothetical protein
MVPAVLAQTAHLLASGSQLLVRRLSILPSGVICRSILSAGTATILPHEQLIDEPANPPETK